jgi:hypothetical protein
MRSGFLDESKYLYPGRYLVDITLHIQWWYRDHGVDVAAAVLVVRDKTIGSSHGAFVVKHR